MSRQYLACEFHPGGRTYTYANDGEPVDAGAKVVVPANQGERIVTVVSTTDDAPPFECKPILRIELINSGEEN